jgi:S-adenosylmethionine-diacylglycerol 3-amino-3-carboxypropyl transferase
VNPQLENIRHDYLRYANCWEDADVLLEALDIQAEDRVVSIGSAGDNSFSILSKNPSLVLAVDVNQVQIHLIELKKACFKSLTYEEFIDFLGFNESKNRKELFEKLDLPLETKKYWLAHFQSIEKGVIHQGKFENYFRIFRSKLLPFIHSQKRIDELIRIKSESEQKQFHATTWDSWSWNLLFKLFFGRVTMGLLGRDPKFFKEVQVPVSQSIKSLADEHFRQTMCQKNSFAHYMLKGSFQEFLPHYARRENFENIKNNIDNLQTKLGFLEDALESFGKFDKFNLSNIFEYMSESQFAEVASQIEKYSDVGSVFVYWNLLVERKLSNVLPEIKHQKELSMELKKKDLGFFYQSFNVDRR